MSYICARFGSDSAIFGIFDAAIVGGEKLEGKTTVDIYFEWNKGGGINVREWKSLYN